MRALDVAVEANYLAEICSQNDMVTGKSNNDKVKPEHSLYGVTFSVADWIDMNGFDSTCGLANRSVKPCSEDAVIIRALRDNLMATPLFRSSVNQGAGSNDISAFASENANHIWGRAKNPLKKEEFSTGGSCGGEAGLVATLSICIGLAVD